MPADEETDFVPPLPAGYTNGHRAFLQAFMARGTLTFGEGQQLVAAILTEMSQARVDPAAVTQDDFAGFVRTAREAVAPLDFDIRSSRRQDPPPPAAGAHSHGRGRGGERVWAFVNAHSDPATQIGTAHSAEEMAYVKRLLDAMFDTYNTQRMEVMAVDEAQALRLSRPARRAAGGGEGGEEEVDDDGEDDDGEDDDDDGGGDGGKAKGKGKTGATAAANKGLKHSEVLTLLRSMEEEGWLEKSRSGFYSLAPRALMELQSWLTETYNEPDATPDEWQRIKTCEACKELLTVGQRCAERDCNVRLHDICLDGYWRTRRDKNCPKCGTAWDGNHFVGERAVTSTQAYQRSRGRRSGGGRRSRTQQEVDEEEEDDD